MHNLLPFVFLLLLMGQGPGAAKLPDTVAGNRVDAYIRAFNSVDEQAMRAFSSENVTPASLEQRPIDARMEFYRRMRGDMGGLEVRRVLLATDSAVTVIVQTRRGDWFEFAFQFESAAPYKLIGLRVEDTEPLSPVAEGESPSTPITEAELIEAAGECAAGAAAADEFSGTVLIAKNGKPVFQKAYGLASKEHNVRNDIDTKFNIRRQVTCSSSSAL